MLPACGILFSFCSRTCGTLVLSEFYSTGCKVLAASLRLTAAALELRRTGARKPPLAYNRNQK